MPDVEIVDLVRQIKREQKRAAKAKRSDDPDDPNSLPTPLIIDLLEQLLPLCPNDAYRADVASLLEWERLLAAHPSQSRTDLADTYPADKRQLLVQSNVRVNRWLEDLMFHQ